MAVLIIAIIFTSIFVLGPISAAVARRIAKGPPGTDPGAAREIGRLRDEVDRLSGEVQRLHEEQHFIVALLGEGDRKRLTEGREPESPEAAQSGRAPKIGEPHAHS